MLFLSTQTSLDWNPPTGHGQVSAFRDVLLSVDQSPVLPLDLPEPKEIPYTPLLLPLFVPLSQVSQNP